MHQSLTHGLLQHPESITLNDVNANIPGSQASFLSNKKAWPWPRQPWADKWSPRSTNTSTFKAVQNRGYSLQTLFLSYKSERTSKKIRPETDHLWHLGSSELIILQSLCLSKLVYCFAPIQGQHWGDLGRMPYWRSTIEMPENTSSIPSRDKHNDAHHNTDYLKEVQAGFYMYIIQKICWEIITNRSHTPTDRPKAV